jgi:group I intron endonuclease
MSKEERIICVYKITSPSGKIYIGSSINYKKRLTQYRGVSSKSQTILYNSFLKYGIENHIFEIVENCTKENLLEREYHYGCLYDVISVNGMNCKLPKFGDKYQVVRQETVEKMRQWKPTEETIQNMKNAQQKRAKESKVSEETKQKLRDANLGKKASEETKKKISIGGKGRIVSDETKLKMKAWKRKPLSEEHKKKLSIAKIGHKMLESTKRAVIAANTGRPFSQKTKENAAKANSRIVFDHINGIYYNSIKEAAELHKMKSTTLIAMLVGQNKNKTNLIYA